MKQAKYSIELQGGKQMEIWVKNPTFCLDYTNFAIFHEDKESDKLVETLRAAFPDITKIEIRLSEIFTLIYE